LGMISDVHQDVMHDGVERLSSFVSAMREAGVDAIAQLGDFCVPHQRNERFLAAWNEFPGEKLHVLGNHDMDGGYRREQTVEYFGCPGRYYSTSVGELRVIVLDGNDPDGRPGYPCNVGEEQQAWLRQELAEHRQPTIVLIHQPIDGFDRHVRSSKQVREILAAANREAGQANREAGQANREAGQRQVLAVFSGHAHLDYLRETDGIPHFQINSASYYWVDKQHENYGPEIQKRHPSLGATCPYADPLWAIVEIDLESGAIQLSGRSTEWVGPDPWELGLPAEEYGRNQELCRPAISHWSYPKS
jgi:Icc protein